jgi:NAD dependent epimerase/dehydratase family enzyme
MGRELFLFSQRCLPAKLLANGFEFTTPKLKDSLDKTIF